MLSLPISLTDLQIDEVLRYMGTPPDRAEPAIRKLAEECAQELLGVARPRWAARTFELTLEEVGVRLSSGLLLPGEDLKRHLAGCRRAVLFCATLSAQADALIRRAESGDMLRYSPGYGDLPLTLQSSLLALLDAPRQVGLCASASHILTPRKSVTAILGVADHPIQASVRSCLGCPAHDSCQYRKSGGHCGIS